jgi:hypothetical protein
VQQLRQFLAILDVQSGLGFVAPKLLRPDRTTIDSAGQRLSPVLLRVIENATGDTWRNTRRELDRLHLVTLATSAGRVAQRSATTPGQQTVLRALDLPEPPRFFDFTFPESR